MEGHQGQSYNAKRKQKNCAKISFNTLWKIIVVESLIKKLLSVKEWRAPLSGTEIMAVRIARLLTKASRSLARLGVVMIICQLLARNAFLLQSTISGHGNATKHLPHLLPTLMMNPTSH